MSRLASLVEGMRDELLRRWSERVREPPPSGGPPRPELEDALPEVLQALGAALRGLPAQPPGPERYRPGFELTAVLREYGLLRDLLLARAEQAEPPISLSEVRTLDRFIDAALTAASEAHTLQREQARHEREEMFVRLQQAERSRAALMAAITEQSFIAVAYMRGPQHVFETDNAVYRKIVGKSDVLGKPLLEAIPELAGPGIDTRLTRVLQTGEPFAARELSVRMDVRGDGVLEDRLFDFIYQPVRAADGTIEGVLDLAVDVTEQVRAREAVRELSEEHRVRLEFEQQLIGIVSHDLRNPLSVILFGTQALLSRGELEPRVARTLGRIQTSAERATRMVRDLLDFTQARLGGGLRIKREPQSLHDVTRAAVEELRATHPERELRLELTGEARGEWDADRLSQVVGNLVSNAVKYSTPGTPVTVRQSEDGDHVLLEVHNQGNPLSPEARNRLFQPLQRAVSTIDKESRSVGLGLYIVEQIIRAHHGEVDVVSTEEAGTTFRVRLPRGP